MTQTISNQLKISGLAFLNLVFPKRCASCSVNLHFMEKQHLCSVCWELFIKTPELFCIKCGVYLPDGGMHCYTCKKEDFQFTLIRAYGPYVGLLKEMVHQMKYNHKDYLAQDLSVLLFEAWMRYPELHGIDLIVPVPLHPTHVRERGYNQSELLAKNLMVMLRQSQTNLLEKDSYNDDPHTNISMSASILLRTRDTPSQTKLSKRDRQDNMAGAFSVPANRRGLIKRKNVLLIDDVSTTHATLNECARTLRRAGAKKVFGLVLAKD